MERQLAESINGGRLRPGDALPSIRELGLAHGVSFAVARRALDRLKQRGLIEGQRGRGLFVARPAPPVNPAATGDVVILGQLQGHVFASFIQRVVTSLDTQGRSARLFDWGVRKPVTSVSPSLNRSLASDNISAIVVAGLSWQAMVRLEPVLPEGVPVVTAYHAAAPLPRVVEINVDHERMHEQAARYFRELGHRRVALFTHPVHEAHKHRHSERSSRNARIISLAASLKQFGAGAQLSVCYDLATRHPAERLGEEHLDHLTKQLRTRRERPTAFFGSDARIVAAIRAAEKLGWQRGRDFDVLGIGNTPWSEAFGFDSLSVGEARAASLAGTLLRLPADMLCANHANVRHLVEPELITRAAPCPSAQEHLISDTSMDAHSPLLESY